MPARGFPDGRVPVVLSAHAAELVAADAEAIGGYAQRRPDTAAVAATLLRTRRLRRHRAVVRAADIDELTDGLRAVCAGVEHPLVTRSSETGATRTVLVFPGQGNQWPSMGAEAYRRLPVYRAQVDLCANAFVAAGEQSPLPYLTAEADGGNWSQVEIQGAQFTHAVGLAHIWRACGVLPDITVGHSLGEVAAAYVAGSITLADAAAVVIARAKAVDRLHGEYGMAVLGVSVRDAEQLIPTVVGWLEVSAVNSGSSVVVSGERDAVTALVSAASAQGVFARELQVDYPGHTSALEPLRDDLLTLLPQGQFSAAAVQFIGSATGTAVAVGTDFGDYWYDNLRNTVRFDRAVGAALQQGAVVFVEMSAHPSLLFALGDLTGDGPGGPPLIVGSGLRDEPLLDTLSSNIAAAASADPSFRWADFADLDTPMLRGFPNAPMRASRLWADPTPLPPVAGLTVSRETWQPRTESVAVSAPRRVAVLDLAGPTSTLSGQLRSAVQRHSGTRAADPADAELVVAVAPLLDHPDAELAAHEISRLVDARLLDYADAAGPACREVCLVTVGGEHVRPGEPVALPAQSALAAIHRSIGFERPDQAFRHLDLPSWEIGDDTVAATVDALLGDVHEGALRDGADGPRLFVRSVTDVVDAGPERAMDRDALDDVVITGGSGAVGLHFARHLAEQGARRIVLLSRGGVDAETLAELRSRAGVEVLAPLCDIRNADEVSAIAREHGGDGASLVIHAAGAATFSDRDALTARDFADTAAAKIGGLARMVELWPLRPAARILVCSSVSGVWGGRGHGAYAAANRMLDVMAGQLRAKGQHCAALRYGLWKTDSRRASAITDRADVSAIERSGLLPMEPELAVAASLREYAGDPLVLTADHDRLQRFLDSQVVTRTPAVADASGTVTTTTDAQAQVRAEVAAVLDLDAATLDLETSLLDLGLDSLLALDLRKGLRRATGTSVPLATLLGGVTSAELIASLDTGERSEKVETTRD